MPKNLMRKITVDRPHMKGRSLEARELLSKYDPDFLEQYHSNYMLVITRKRALPIKFKEMIIMAYDAATCYEPGLRTHMIQALKAGASKEEILEALETISLPGGGHVISFSLPIYHEIVESQK